MHTARAGGEMISPAWRKETSPERGLCWPRSCGAVSRRVGCGRAPSGEVAQQPGVINPRLCNRFYYSLCSEPLLTLPSLPTQRARHCPRRYTAHMSPQGRCQEAHHSPVLLSAEHPLTAEVRHSSARFPGSPKVATARKWEDARLPSTPQGRTGTQHPTAPPTPQAGLQCPVTHRRGR